MSRRSLVRMLVALAFAVSAQRICAAEAWRGEADIEFSGTSTLHDFEGNVKADPFIANVSIDGKTATLGGTVVVAVVQMNTGHSKRDANMRKMFDSLHFPRIVGVVDPVQIDTGAARLRVPMKLTIRDQTQTVSAKIKGWKTDGNSVQFELEMTLSLKESGLVPPTILGIIRVGDAVPVRAHVVLKGPTYDVASAGP
ncbi:MAG TPA: YceI family protein [Kiritimatiellia bacterium]|nr:YceI family protein [Kiritimatiellia bacterium]